MTRVSVAALLAVAGACSQPLEIPAPPNLDPVLAAYDNPTGTIDPVQVKQTLADAQARLDELHLDWWPPLVVDLASRLRQRFQSSGLPVDPAAVPDDNHRNIDAVITLTHACTGFHNPGESTTKQENGTLDLTAVVQTGRLSRAIWGTATTCQEPIAITNQRTVDAEIDGNLILYLYGALPRTAADLQLLVHIERPPSALDFRVMGTVIEFRLPVSDGDVIVSVSPNQLTLRGHNQTAVCDLTTRACRSGTGP